MKRKHQNRAVSKRWTLTTLDDSSLRAVVGGSVVGGSLGGNLTSPATTASVDNQDGTSRQAAC
jgi:hypothetical protein